MASQVSLGRVACMAKGGDFSHFDSELQVTHDSPRGTDACYPENQEKPSPTNQIPNLLSTRLNASNKARIDSYLLPITTE